MRYERELTTVEMRLEREQEREREKEKEDKQISVKSSQISGLLWKQKGQERAAVRVAEN